VPHTAAAARAPHTSPFLFQAAPSPIHTPQVCFFAHAEDEIRHPTDSVDIKAAHRNVPSPRRAAAEARRRSAAAQLSAAAAATGAVAGCGGGSSNDFGVGAMAAATLGAPQHYQQHGSATCGIMQAAGHYSPSVPDARNQLRAYSLPGSQGARTQPPAVAGPRQQRWSAPPVFLVRHGGEGGSGTSFISDRTSSGTGCSSGLMSMASLSSTSTGSAADFALALQQAGLPPGSLSRTISSATSAGGADAAAEVLQSLLLEAQAGRQAADTATAAALRADAAASLAASRALALAEEMGLTAAMARPLESQQQQALGGSGGAAAAAGDAAGAAASPRWTSIGGAAAGALAVSSAMQAGSGSGSGSGGMLGMPLSSGGPGMVAMLQGQQVRSLSVPCVGPKVAQPLASSPPRRQQLQQQAAVAAAAAGLVCSSPDSPPGLPEPPGLLQELPGLAPAFAPADTTAAAGLLLPAMPGQQAMVFTAGLHSGKGTGMLSLPAVMEGQPVAEDSFSEAPSMTLPHQQVPTCGPVYGIYGHGSPHSSI
jgi:hypothetical protein